MNEYTDEWIKLHLIFHVAIYRILYNSMYGYCTFKIQDTSHYTSETYCLIYVICLQKLYIHFKRKK